MTPKIPFLSHFGNYEHQKKKRRKQKILIFLFHNSIDAKLCFLIFSKQPLFCEVKVRNLQYVFGATIRGKSCQKLQDWNQFLRCSLENLYSSHEVPPHWLFFFCFCKICSNALAAFLSRTSFFECWVLLLSWVFFCLLIEIEFMLRFFSALSHCIVPETVLDE